MILFANWRTVLTPKRITKAGSIHTGNNSISTHTKSSVAKLLENLQPAGQSLPPLTQNVNKN